MKVMLKISIEDSWRMSSLETVKPIADLVLEDHPGIPGLKEILNGYRLKLSSEKIINVYCSIRGDQQVNFSLDKKEDEFFSITTPGAFYIQIRLPDRKFYQFELVLLN